MLIDDFMMHNAHITEFRAFKTASNNATGSFEGATITAGASTSSMGAVLTYQDNAGTNTLNTDIILKLSADGWKQTIQQLHLQLYLILLLVLRWQK